MFKILVNMLVGNIFYFNLVILLVISILLLDYIS